MGEQQYYTRKPRALFHGLSAVANDSAGAPPLFVVQPLPNSTVDFPTLKSWFGHSR
ncbi:MAG: hypothetical protein V7K27_01140 [Nostoc sp.]